MILLIYYFLLCWIFFAAWTFLSLQQAGATPIAVHGLLIPVVLIVAQGLRYSWHVRSTQIRVRTCVLCIDRWILYHWAAEEAPTRGFHCKKMLRFLFLCFCFMFCALFWEREWEPDPGGWSVGFSKKVNRVQLGPWGCVQRVTMGPDGIAGRGWAGMCWASRAAQRTIESGAEVPQRPLPEEAWPPRILGAQHAIRGVLEWDISKCPHILDSSAKSLAHTTYQANPYAGRHLQLSDNESLWCTPETNTMLYIRYSSINRKISKARYIALNCVQLFGTPRTVAPPGSSVRRILQARILEWVAISSSYLHNTQS